MDVEKIKSFLSRVGKIFNYILGKFEDYAVTVFFMTMIVVVFVQITFRALGGIEHHLTDWVPAVPWTEELARYAMAYLVFVGASVTAKEGAHVGITAFASSLSPRLERILRTVALLIAFAFTLIVLNISWGILLFMMDTGQISPVLGVPMWMVFLALPIGSALMSIRFLQAAYNQFTQKKEEDPTKVDLAKENAGKEEGGVK